MPTQTPKKISILQGWFWFITRLLGWLIVGCLGCIIMAIIMVALQGKASGFMQLHQLIHEDYQYLMATIQPNTLMPQLPLPEGLLHLPKYLQMPTFQSIQLPMIRQSVNHMLATVWFNLLPFIQAGLLGIKLLIIRLNLLLYWCPLFLLLGFVGFIDGLAQHHIRRQSAGRESVAIYHQAKGFMQISFMLGIFINLILPISVIHAEAVLVVAAILFGLFVQVSAKRFKKYL